MVFQDSLFSSPLFLLYKESLIQHMAVAQNPIHHEIQGVLPKLCCQITINNEALRTQLTDSVNSFFDKVIQQNG
jgi:hypothetical protein